MATTTMAPSPAPQSPKFEASSRPNISARSSLASPSQKRASLQRPLSTFSKNRLSVYSTMSNNQSRSRPTSHIFSAFPSSLPYAIVRDFAYPTSHPFHYGAPPKDSGISTPVTESRRLSDPPSWDSSHSQWPAPHWDPGTMYSHQQLPPIAFGDGPPYSEDEDLHSPVVVISRHRRIRSDDSRVASGGRQDSTGHIPGTDNSHQQGDRGVLIRVNGDGTETYYFRGDDADENGPGGDVVTYAGGDNGHPYLSPGSYDYDTMEGQQDQSRFSRDYQITIVSPDEEVHGKAVALFDFTREHENELPLKEGQVILVSYRQEHGWLVAEDPRTGENGLVPEEFVCLLKDIEGGLNGLTGDLNTPSEANVSGLDPEQTAIESPPHPNDTIMENTPDQPESPIGARIADNIANDSESTQSKDKDRTREIHPAVVSTFSTSSRDLNPYPSHLLSNHQHSRSTPPQIEHIDTNNTMSASQSSKRPKSISKQP